MTRLLKAREQLAASFSGEDTRKAHEYNQQTGWVRRSTGIGFKRILLNVKYLTKILASRGRERVWLFKYMHGIMFN